MTEPERGWSGPRDVRDGGGGGSQVSCGVFGSFTVSLRVSGERPYSRDVSPYGFPLLSYTTWTLEEAGNGVEIPLWKSFPFFRVEVFLQSRYFRLQYGTT